MSCKKKGRFGVPCPRTRAAFAAALIVLAAGSSVAHAGFVEEFVEASQASVNVTEAGVIESSALNVVTGGGFVYKTPRREFVPLSITPPSLKSGCGGIDVFLGAFSIPSRDEFVSFLKSVGTALPGLAFQLALQTMAPDLNEMVGRYSDLIRSYTNRYTDSCQAAEALLEASGAKGHMQQVLLDAKNRLRASGEAADQSEADRAVRTNGQKAIESAPTRTDAAGNIVAAAEMNLTWAILVNGRWQSGSMDALELRELMMTLVGTTIFKKAGEGEDAVIKAASIAGVDLLPALFGEVQTQGVQKLKCDEAKKCLSPALETMRDVDLTARMQLAADNYLSAIEKRDASLVSNKDLMLLAASSGVPLIRILNLASLTRYAGFAQDLVHVYVSAAAYEVLASAVHALSRDVGGVLASSSAAGLTKEHVEHVEKLKARLAEVEAQVHQREDRVMQSMMRASGLIEQLEHIERSLVARRAQALGTVLPALAPVR